MTHVLAATDDDGGSSGTMIEEEEKNGNLVPTAPTSYFRGKSGTTNVDNNNSNDHIQHHRELSLYYIDDKEEWCAPYCPKCTTCSVSVLLGGYGGGFRCDVKNGWEWRMLYSDGKRYRLYQYGDDDCQEEHDEYEARLRQSSSTTNNCDEEEETTTDSCASVTCPSDGSTCNSDHGECEYTGLTTSDSYTYYTVNQNDSSTKMSVTGNYCVVVQVKASNDAHIGFFHELPSSSENWARGKEFTEFVIGGWRNTRSVIRKVGQGDKYASVYNFASNGDDGFLSSNDYKTYWACANQDKAMLGQGDTVGQNTIIYTKFEDSTTTNSAYDMNYVAISTGWGATGDWASVYFTNDNGVLS